MTPSQFILLQTWMQFVVLCKEPAKDTYVFPAQGRLAVFTVDICYSMQACQQNSLFCRTTPNVHPERKEEADTSRDTER